MAEIKEENLNPFKNKCLHFVNRWRRLAFQWLPLVKEGTVKLVLYEDLKANTLPEIRDVVSFLNIVNLDQSEYEERLSCLEAHMSGQFHRQKTTEKRQKDMRLFQYLGIQDKIAATFQEVNSLVIAVTNGSKKLNFTNSLGGKWAINPDKND